MPYVSNSLDEESSRLPFYDDDLESLTEESILGPKFIRGVANTVGGLAAAPINAVAGAVGAVVNGVRGAVVNTPAGQARMDFQQPVATQQSVQQLAQELRASIARVNQNVERNTAIVDRKVETLEKIVRTGQQQDQMSTLLPMLLSSPPQIDKITLDDDSVLEVANTSYAPADNMPLLLMMMMGGNSPFGGGSQNNSLMFALMLSGAFSTRR